MEARSEAKSDTAIRQTNPALNTPRRYLFSVLGCIMLAMGALGAVLPLLPTTPFLLAAAACFSRSFPRLETWLLTHPHFGPPLVAWKQSGTISSRIKALAVMSMLASYAIFLLTTETEPHLQLVVALALSGCSTFILSRPSRVKA